jgi:hypothetical protein
MVIIGKVVQDIIVERIITDIRLVILKLVDGVPERTVLLTYPFINGQKKEDRESHLIHMCIMSQVKEDHK